MTGREGRLSWEARAEEVSFEVLPKRYNRGTISYMERESSFRSLLLIVKIHRTHTFPIPSAIMRRHCGTLHFHIMPPFTLQVIPPMVRSFSQRWNRAKCHAIEKSEAEI